MTTTKTYNKTKSDDEVVKPHRMIAASWERHRQTDKHTHTNTHGAELRVTHPKVPFPDMGGLGGFCVGGLVRGGAPPPPAFMF